MECLLCQSDTKSYFNYGRYTSQPYGLVWCVDCGLVQTDPMPTDDFLNNWYQKYDVLGDREPYYQGLASDDPWRTPEGVEIRTRFALVKKWMAQSPVTNLKCLDVGAGQGHFLELVKRAGWSGVGIELNREAAAKAQERFGIDVRVGSFDSVGLPRESFDLITLWDIFEHVPNPLHALERAQALLKPGGYLFMETPNVKSLLDAAVISLARFGIRGPAKTFYGLHHLTLWHPEIIKRALQEAGFTVNEIKCVSTPARRIFRGGVEVWLKVFIVEFIQFAGSFFGRQNKMIIVAQKNNMK